MATITKEQLMAALEHLLVDQGLLRQFVQGDEDTIVPLGLPEPVGTDSLRRAMSKTKGALGLLVVEAETARDQAQTAKDIAVSSAANAANSAALASSSSTAAFFSSARAAWSEKRALDAAAALANYAGTEVNARWTPWGVAISACRSARTSIVQSVKIYNLQKGVKDNVSNA